MLRFYPEILCGILIFGSTAANAGQYGTYSGALRPDIRASVRGDKDWLPACEIVRGFRPPKTVRVSYERKTVRVNGRLWMLDSEEDEVTIAYDTDAAKQMRIEALFRIDAAKEALIIISVFELDEADHKVCVTPFVYKGGFARAQ